MAASHLAGPTVADAVRICTQASQRGWSTTIGYWNSPLDTPAIASLAYTAALKAILEGPLDAYLSVKATILNYDFGLVNELIAPAASRGVRIHFDAMDPTSATPTFALLERALKSHRNLGCTLPSRWHRSLNDANRVIELGIPVRIVKGQWTDPLDPHINPRSNYLELVNRLSGKAVHVAIATHDRPLATAALQILKKSGTQCEMEQLSSLPQNCVRIARSLQIPLRIYVPFGYPSLPYDIWQARARFGIVAWAMRDFLTGKHRPLSAAS